MKKILTCLAALFLIGTLHATTYYASPDGSGNGTSYASPTSWSSALSKLQSSDSLYLLGGTYLLNDKQSIGTSKAGTESARTFIGAYPGEKPVFDFRNQPYGREEHDYDNTGISIGANYIHLKGIELCYTGKSGIVNNGSYSLFENLDVHGCGDTGIQMKAGNNTILNCDSHDNFDYKLGGTESPDYGGNADGFADKKYAEAPGNHYIGCRAWNNSDDGWDFYERKSTSETIIENCICYANGPATYNMSDHPRYKTDKDWFDNCGENLAQYKNYGNGNGFKLGGNDDGHEYEHNVTVHHCLSVGHPSGKKGFDRNNNAGIMNLYNNTAYNNGINYGFHHSNKTEKGTLNIQNCISFQSGSADVLAIANVNNHNTWNSGFSVSSSDFQSTDESLILAARNADGSLPENAFMRLADNSALIDAGVNVGYAFEGEASDLGCYEATSTKPTPIAATFAWEVGNEKEATITSEKSEYVKETNVTVGTSLTVGTASNYDANPGKTMVTYQPATTGSVASVMIEYSIKMKKGTTFKLKNITYDAVKDGTDNASYSWSYAIDGVDGNTTTVAQEYLLRNNNKNAATASLNHSETISAAAGQEIKVRFFVSGFANTKKFALSNIKLIGTISGEPEVRAFKDFKIDFRSNEPTIVLPEGGPLPANVALSNLNYKDSQHGIQGGTITVQVDGPVKFTLGGCGYGNNIAVKKNGTDLTTIDNKVGCDGSGVGNGYTKFVTWLYNVEEAAELSFTVNGYLPYFFAEACEYVPQVTVHYYDVDGETPIGEEVVDGSSALAYKYGAANVTVAEGEAFRGWFASADKTASKIPEGTILTEDLNLYAHATAIEVAHVGDLFEYDLRQAYFYPEDHELLTIQGGSYKDAQHGWQFGNGGSMSVEVAGKALLIVGICRYSEASTTDVKDASGNKVGEIVTHKSASEEGALQTVRYEGEATTLTFYFTATNYIHTLEVYNIAAMPEKNAAGYYEIEAGNAKEFRMIVESAEAGDKIFLPNGTYDLGETCLMTVSKNNISIIGESTEGTIIKNTPMSENEGIATTATLLINANNTYLQDLTLWNNLDYFETLAKMGNARGVCLQDKGSQTICKNVRMLSNQDTYYSNMVGGLKYFEDCEIHGTVDFICGDGNVYFKNNVLVGEQRNKNGGGANAITASNAATSDKGFVLEGCRVLYAENIEGTKPVMSFGRSWNNAPKCVFLNTILDDSNGELNMIKKTSVPKDSINRWHIGAMTKLPEKLGEFNSVDKDGNVVSPTSHNITFVLGSAEKQMETILTAEDAATYTMSYTLGAWAETAAADVAQATANQKAIDAEAAYLIENEGDFVAIVKGSDLATTIGSYIGKTMRQANNRGAFGAPVTIIDTITAIEEMSELTNPGVIKFIQDGQLLIRRDDHLYTPTGQRVK